MRIDRFELSLEKPSTGHDYHLAGGRIKGNIHLKVVRRVRVARLTLRLVGSAHTAWLDKFTNTLYDSKELIVDDYKDLTSHLSLHCNEIMEVFEGEHDIGFHFQLPMDANSSIEKEGFGSVKYCCVASLDIPEEGGDSEIVAEADLSVISYLNLDAPHLCDPVHSSEQVNVTGVCFNRPRGWIRADLCVSELGLLPGRSCTVTLTVENTVKKARAKKHKGDQHRCGLLSLCQQVDFRARAKERPNTWERRSLTTAVQSYGTCKANCVKGPESRQIEFMIPADLPPTSTKENGLIACSYFFRIEMDDHFDVICPVVIGSHKTENKCSVVADAPAQKADAQHLATND